MENPIDHNVPSDVPEFEPAAQIYTTGPNVVITFCDGGTSGWPRVLLQHWAWSPRPDGERLLMRFSEQDLLLDGKGLKSLLPLLEEGRGINLIEGGARYAGVLAGEGAYIRAAKVEAREI